ncbi:Threonine/Serine exporter ThrE domain-containing protein OS=Lysinibacillus sphaericus OX=1421 GN=LS41612_20750 PE=3 SV=1 [Lysinibacillus sphaericus]
MDIITQLIVSFFSTAGIAIIFNVPRKTLFCCGVVGVIRLDDLLSFDWQGLDVVDASFFSSFIIVIVAHLYARRFGMWMIIFIVAVNMACAGGMADMAMVMLWKWLFTGLQYG